MTMVIPYTSQQLLWHLGNNVFRLNRETQEKIVEQCQLVNMGIMRLTDEIAPQAGITIAEMLEDLNIEYNA